jgi:hypothetical protein
MHVVARQAVGRGDEHAVDRVAFDGIAQAVEPRARQYGPTVVLLCHKLI